MLRISKSMGLAMAIRISMCTPLIRRPAVLKHKIAATTVARYFSSRASSPRRTSELSTRISLSAALFRTRTRSSGHPTCSKNLQLRSMLAPALTTARPIAHCRYVSRRSVAIRSSTLTSTRSPKCHRTATRKSERWTRQ